MLHITTIKLLSFGSSSVLSCDYSIVKQIWKLLNKMVFTAAIAGFLTLAAPEMSSFENTLAWQIGLSMYTFCNMCNVSVSNFSKYWLYLILARYSSTAISELRTYVFLITSHVECAYTSRLNNFPLLQSSQTDHHRLRTFNIAVIQ